MSMIEEWRPIAGYEGLYEVSNLGRVQSLDRVLQDKNGLFKRFEGKILKSILKKNPYGTYAVVRLPKDGGHVNCYIAHLVLEAFKGARPTGMECCHCDGDSLNNTIDNLRWDTPRENTNDKYKHGTVLIGDKNHQTKLSDQQVVEIRSRYIRKSKYKTNSADLAKEYGVSRWTINQIGQYKTRLFID